MNTINTPKRRLDERENHQARSINLHYNIIGYAISSVLFEIGETKVLVNVTLQPNVPPFLKGQGVGWLTAEYAMLPCATQQRTMRESHLSQRNSRNVEISRLISRCLRTTVDLKYVREKTIVVDCDVLQADGGTRVACITAASLALEYATHQWYKNGITEKNIFREPIAALSAGIVNGTPYLDLTYEEDSKAEGDFNFVISQSGKLIEIQGTAEQNPISWDHFEILKTMALDGIAHLFNTCTSMKPTALFDSPKSTPENRAKSPSKAPLFSIGNRLAHK